MRDGDAQGGEGRDEEQQAWRWGRRVDAACLVGVETLRVRVLRGEDDPELAAAGVTKRALRDYAERRLGAEGARLAWERREDDPAAAAELTVSCVLLPLGPGGADAAAAGSVVSLCVQFHRPLMVAPPSIAPPLLRTEPILWSRCALARTGAGAARLAAGLWPLYGRVLDEFCAAWRVARYARTDLPARPPVRPPGDDEGPDGPVNRRWRSADD